MVNRELIRIKIVQLTYAYYQNGGRNMDVAEKELLFSLSKAYHLYNHLLALIVAVSDEARKHYDTECSKATREHLEMPSSKFVDNSFALILAGNEQLSTFRNEQKTSWNDDIDFVRKLYNQIVNSQTYKDYMESGESSFEEDRELWRKLYRTLVMDNDELDAVLEEKSLYWNDDKEIVDTFVLKTIKRIQQTDKADMPLLPEFKDEEDREFARKLYRATILNAEQYQMYMSQTSHNWDFSRLAYMDVVIMQIAIAEMMTFPNIPISVTINEYVDLAKVYSTPKSGSYINGMLDSIARHLVETGVLLKPIGEMRKR
ncbi:MAG: transcription antitermination factor NusB [Bacteroidales bacterium]|nr:transcription antitermination factor NusB [Bacteroidales bacterium]MDY2693339.1 transcription antitermination factor NusB [Prevotella sp.]MDD5787846.1 transcription antitermination factor NusB [Bacteroidales bacterium]MDD6897329.1 transcription antitermination factor NusB [Bacteroidales bacterium]MDY4731785.1 transcription antitermination factor NusB [Prevotella sp.]